MSVETSHLTNPQSGCQNLITISVTGSDEKAILEFIKQQLKDYYVIVSFKASRPVVPITK